MFQWLKPISYGLLTVTTGFYKMSMTIGKGSMSLLSSTRKNKVKTTGYAFIP